MTLASDCTHRQGRCLDRADYLAGDHPTVRAQVKPAHSQRRATLWRRAPHETWAKLKTVAISEDGHMVYAWTPKPRDARRYAYRFRFAVFGHGQSDVVRMHVYKPDY